MGFPAPSGGWKPPLTLASSNTLISSAWGLDVPDRVGFFLLDCGAPQLLRGLHTTLGTLALDPARALELEAGWARLGVFSDMCYPGARRGSPGFAALLCGREGDDVFDCFSLSSLLNALLA
eukprot:m.474180 g.474180  ORF g.474180 m.474180 type:complete len:121 (+) comp35847_c0_seq1:90-452(+)